MKQITLFAIIALLTGLRTDAKNSAITADWQQKVEQQITKDAYSFHDACFNTFNTTNSKQSFACTISSTGYQVTHLQTQQPDNWTVSFHLNQINNKSFALQSQSLYESNLLVLHYKDADVRYTNTIAGLRQDFILHKKPDNGPINLSVSIQSNLSPYVRGNGQLVLKGSDSKDRVVYDDLHVWDATNRALPASFALQGNELTISVDDKDAVYPVTIDPLTRQPEWNTSASGVLNGLLSGQINASLYGYTVAYVGDVNGDTYGDVAVGAPGLTSLLGTGTAAQVGAVYIFPGTATGLSTTPYAILQPNTAVAGALFGFSIDGEDIDSDGYSDIIVGAPLDQVTVNVGSGPTGATIGKVYYYSGAMLGNSNPSPLLTLNVNTSQISLLNIGNKALFGYSVAITNDLNNDGKKDILVGAPGFSGPLALLRTGGAYVFYSQGSGTYSAGSSLQPPTLLAGIVPVAVNIDQLLFGYSVDAAGDFNADGRPDLVVGAPGGDAISSITNIASGQILGGRASVYFGTASAVNTTAGTQLTSPNSTVVASIGNLFGFSVRGLRNTNGILNGNIAVGAPLAGTITNTLSLAIQTGSVNIFKAAASPGARVTPTQVLESPRSSSILSLLNNYNLNALLGASIDNMYDANGDSYPDLIVGEPLSTGTNILGLQASLTGGNAYVYAGNSSGTFNTTPIFTVTATYGGAFASVNAVPLFGFSVSGIRNPSGNNTRSRLLVGSPASSLDFSSGLLNLGGTVGSLMNFAAGNNGPGSAFTFDALNNVPLPVHLLSFEGVVRDDENVLTWKTTSDRAVNGFELERSADGRNWSIIGKYGAKQETQTITYESTDASPLAGNNLYRLKILYTDNTSAFSQVVTLRNQLTEGEMLQVYPNPVTDIISIKAPAGDERILRVISNSGAVLYNQIFVSGDNGATRVFKKSDLGMNVPGTYTIELTGRDGTTTHRLVSVQN